MDSLGTHDSVNDRRDRHHGAKCRTRRDRMQNLKKLLHSVREWALGSLACQYVKLRSLFRDEVNLKRSICRFKNLGATSENSRGMTWANARQGPGTGVRVDSLAITNPCPYCAAYSCPAHSQQGTYGGGSVRNSSVQIFDTDHSSC